MAKKGEYDDATLEAAQAAIEASTFLRVDAQHDSVCFSDIDGNEVVLDNALAPQGITFAVNQEVNSH